MFASMEGGSLGDADGEADGAQLLRGSSGMRSFIQPKLSGSPLCPRLWGLR